MQSFRTLDDADVKGKRVLVRVDLNVPMHDGKVADVSRIERNAPTITEIADKGGKVILLSHLRPAEGPRPEGIAQAGRRRGRAHHQPADRLCRRTASARSRRKRGRRHEARRHSLPGKHPLSSRAKKTTTANSPNGSARSAISSSTTRSRSRIARMPRSRRSRICCRPMPAAPCAHELDALEHAPCDAPAASGHGHRRRRQDLDQARSARQSARPRSRR